MRRAPSDSPPYVDHWTARVPANILVLFCAFRHARSRFNHTGACRGYNFVKAVTGDYRGCTNAMVRDFTANNGAGGWIATRGGPCNANKHTQWNCEPELGIRHHCKDSDPAVLATDPKAPWLRHHRSD